MVASAPQQEEESQANHSSSQRPLFMHRCEKVSRCSIIPFAEFALLSCRVMTPILAAPPRPRTLATLVLTARQLGGASVEPFRKIPLASFCCIIASGSTSWAIWAVPAGAGALNAGRGLCVQCGHDLKLREVGNLTTSLELGLRFLMSGAIFRCTSVFVRIMNVCLECYCGCL